MKDVAQSGFASRTLLLVTCAYAILATALLTNFDFNLLGAERYGLAFNDMAQRLLHFDWTVDHKAIGDEAFVINGRTYSYFGILPALLRMPLIPLGLGNIFVARISCIIAVTMYVWSNIRLAQVIAATRPGKQSQLLVATWGAALILSGPPVYLLASAWVYNEPIFWAAALTALFNFIVLRGFFQGEWPEGWRLTGLASVAGLTLLARIPNGVGLLVAVGLFWLRTSWRWRIGEKGVFRSLAFTALVTVCFIGAIGFENSERWGNPFVFARFEKLGYIAADDRALQIVELGTFSAARVPFSALYFITGLPVKGPFADFLLNHYAIVEGPRIPLILVSPLPLLLACWGIIALFRAPLALVGIPTVLIGSEVVSSLLVLGTPFLAWRYVFDFWGVISASAAIGLWHLLQKKHGWLLYAAMLFLLAVGILASGLSLVRYKISNNGVPSDVRYALSRTLQPRVCPGAAVTGSISSMPPLVTPSCPPLW